MLEHQKSANWTVVWTTGSERPETERSTGRRRSKSEKPKIAAQRSRLTLLDQEGQVVAVIVMYINVMGYL